MPHQPTPPLFNTVPSPQEIDIAKKTVHVLIDKRDAFAKLKDEALAKRDAAKGADAIEAAKRELDSANRQFEQAKRQLDDAKRQLEQLQRQNEAPTHGEQFTYTTKPRPPVAVESPTGAAAQPATPEEIKILHERVNTIEDQLKFAQERLKAGKGATTLDVIQVGCDLALAQSDVALAEGRLDEAIAKLQQAQKQAEDAVKIASTAARAGVGGDYEAILKAKRNLSDIKLKLIPLQSPPYIAPQAIPNTTIEPTRPPQPPRVKSAMPSAKIPDWARPTTALAPAQPAPPAKEFGRPARLQFHLLRTCLISTLKRPRVGGRMGKRFTNSTQFHPPSHRIHLQRPTKRKRKLRRRRRCLQPRRRRDPASTFQAGRRQYYEFTSFIHPIHGLR